MESSWTPFDCLVVADQTPAGLLLKDANEVDVLVTEDVELRSANTEPMVPLNDKHLVDTAKASSGKWVDRTRNDIMLQITTHRTVFWRQHQGKRMARFLHHSQVLNLTTESGYFKSPKLLLSTAALGDLLVVFPKDKARLRDDCQQAMQKVLTRQEWVNAATGDSSANNRSVTPQQTSTRRVGVDAILTRNARRHQHAAKITDTAFDGDAETLLKEAQGLVQIIHKYVATLDRQQEGSQDDAAHLVGMLENMGMTSGLARENFAGRAYLDQVARELVDFCRPKLNAQNPFLTLTDAYCLFNRARGTHLLSPSDVRQAADRCGELQLGVSVRVFPSGLVVLQDDNYADPARVMDRLREMLQTTPSLTALEVSRHWKMSAVLAMEQLRAVEETGFLVRDETLESLTFYPNRFSEWEKKE